jgi:hypothetical protein
MKAQKGQRYSSILSLTSAPDGDRYYYYYYYYYVSVCCFLSHSHSQGVIADVSKALCRLCHYGPRSTM